MKSARFEITRLLLTLIGSLALAWLGLDLVAHGGSASARGIGWLILVVMAVGLAAALRKRKA